MLKRWYFVALKLSSEIASSFIFFLKKLIPLSLINLFDAWKGTTVKSYSFDKLIFYFIVCHVFQAVPFNPKKPHNSSSLMSVFKLPIQRRLSFWVFSCWVFRFLCHHSDGWNFDSGSNKFKAAIGCPYWDDSCVFNSFDWWEVRVSEVVFLFICS